jgi:hypothetical protein
MITEKHREMSEGKEEYMSSVGEYVNRGSEQFYHMVEDRPTRSLLVACLAGFGVGFLFTRLLTEEQPTARYSAFDRSTAERFGRNLLEKVEHALPAMLRDRLMK